MPPVVPPVAVRFLAYITVEEDHCGLECELSDGKRILIEFWLRPMNTSSRRFVADSIQLKMWTKNHSQGIGKLIDSRPESF